MRVERYLGQLVRIVIREYLVYMTFSDVALTNDPSPFPQSLPHLLLSKTYRWWADYEVLK